MRNVLEPAARSRRDSRPGRHAVVVGMAGLLLSGASALAAQSRNEPRPFTMWATVAPLNVVGEGAAAALTAQVRRVVFSTRIALWDDPCDASDCWPNGDIGLVVGIGTEPGRRWHLYGGAGVAYGFDDNARFFAMPLQAEAAWRPLPFLGLGLMGYASLGAGKGMAVVGSSDPRSFAGIALAVQIGKVR